MRRTLHTVISSIATILAVVLLVSCVHQLKDAFRPLRLPDSPFSVRDANLIVIQPFQSTFRIPDEWTKPKDKPNLFLSNTELLGLNEIRDYGIKFDDENGAVIDAALPFQDCAVHVGDKSWNNANWNDLQVRFYVVSSTPEELTQKVERDGLAKARDVFEEAKFSTSVYKEWTKHTLSVLDAPDHFLLNKKIDFYFRQYEYRAAVFVFLHAGGFDSTVAEILDSFGPGQLAPKEKSL